MTSGATPFTVELLHRPERRLRGLGPAHERPAPVIIAASIPSCTREPGVCRHLRLAAIAMPRNRRQRAAKPYYRIGEVADLLGMSPDTVRRWADGGRLQPAAAPAATAWLMVSS